MLVYKLNVAPLVQLDGASAFLVLGNVRWGLTPEELLKLVSSCESELVEDGRKLRGLKSVAKAEAEGTRGEKVAAAIASRKAEGLCRRCNKKVAVVDGEPKAFCPRHLKEAQSKMAKVWKARDAANKARKKPAKKSAKKAAKK